MTKMKCIEDIIKDLIDEAKREVGTVICEEHIMPPKQNGLNGQGVAKRISGTPHYIEIEVYYEDIIEGVAILCHELGHVHTITSKEDLAHLEKNPCLYELKASQWAYNHLIPILDNAILQRVAWFYNRCLEGYYNSYCVEDMKRHYIKELEYSLDEVEV